MEENKRNPTISDVKYVGSRNHFVIKYKNDEVRVKFVNLIMELINKHEIKDFHIEEKKAFLENKIIYNSHSLTRNPNIDIKELHTEFFKYFVEL